MVYQSQRKRILYINGENASVSLCLKEIQMKFFISDLHFGSNEILIRENRPFSSMKKFKKFCINLWNKQAKRKDEIWVVGDFVNFNKNNELSKEEIAKIFKLAKKIRAKIILIIGNGEDRVINKYFNNDFEQFKTFCKKQGIHEVLHDAYIKVQDEYFYLNHFPHKCHKNTNNMFGHTHRVTGIWKPYGLNVGCDLNHFQLFSENEILRLLEMKRKWWDKDIDNFCM